MAPAPAVAQALAPTLLDDFNRPDSPTVDAGWVETETTSQLCPAWLDHLPFGQDFHGEGKEMGRASNFPLLRESFVFCSRLATS